MAATLSLAVIAENQAADLAVLIDAVGPACDEIVVIDTGSVDDTRDLAASRGAKVEEVVWRRDFSAARNASFAWCTCDWIIWLDATDRIPPSTLTALHDLKGWLSGQVDAVVSPHDLVDLGEWDNRVRIIRRESGLRWAGRVYESVAVASGRSVLAPELVVRRLQSTGNERVRQLVLEEMEGGTPSSTIRFQHARSLLIAGRFEEALNAFRSYLINSGDRGAERYWALVCLSECGRALGDRDTVRSAAGEAVGIDPARAEAYIDLGRLHYDVEEWDQAVPPLVAATAGRPPHMGYLRPGDYRYAAWDYLSICYDRLGRRNEALNAAARALTGNPDGERVKTNMRWMIDHL